MSHHHACSSRLIALATIGALSSLAAAQQERPAITFSETATSTRATAREWTGTTWATATSTNVLDSDVAWLDVVNSPASTDRALMTMGRSRSLNLSLWTGAFWGPAATMTTDAGASGAKVFATAYECNSGQLMTVYRKASLTSVFFRTFTSAIAPEQTLTMSLPSAPNWIELAARPRSDELVMIVRSGSTLQASVWNGASWGNTVTLETSASTIGRAFSVAYMTQSGKAMVVWSATTGAPKYRVWDGNAGSWSAAGTLPAIAGAVPVGWMTITPNPAFSSNELLFAAIGTNRQINLNNWTGSAWGTNLVAETSAVMSTERRVDIGYQSDGGNAIAAWHKSGQNALRYRTWNGAAWSTQATGPDMGSESQAIRLAPGPDPTQVVMAVRRRGPLRYSDFMAYSQGGSVNLSGTINGPIGEGGVALPPPPVAAAGGTSIILGNNDTRTITPGNYANLETGNSCTLNFSAGTYVFTFFAAHNNGTTFNFDTSAGPINFILTNGNFDGKNGMTFNNLGSDQINLHLLNGDFDSKNNNFCDNLALYAYNGNIVFGNNLNFQGMLYASGNITGSGNISLPTINPWSNGPGFVSAVTFTAGVPGSKVELGTSAEGFTNGGCALAGKPPPRSMRVVRWREIGPDE